MIEREFSNESEILFGHLIAISDDEEWGIAHPKGIFFRNIIEPINVYEYFEERGYNFSFSLKETMYFRRKK